MAKRRQLIAVDLFCGAGGLTRGLLDAGIEVVAGYDIDESCSYLYICFVGYDGTKQQKYRIVFDQNGFKELIGQNIQ